MQELVDRLVGVPVEMVRHSSSDHSKGTCKKVFHRGEGYLHSAEDDSPYDVDGCVYCGRCHMFLYSA